MFVCCLLNWQKKSKPNPELSFYQSLIYVIGGNGQEGLFGHRHPCCTIKLVGWLGVIYEWKLDSVSPEGCMQPTRRRQGEKPTWHAGKSTEVKTIFPGKQNDGITLANSAARKTKANFFRSQINPTSKDGGIIGKKIRNIKITDCLHN